MKLLELSKTELLSFIHNALPDIHFDEDIDCASCGQHPTKYSYICDKCEELLKESE